MANINENGYILSDKIKVYPCAYRGKNINEEARLSTEFNISHTAGLKLGNYGKDSYVVAYANNVLKFVIHGYYFEATLASDDIKPNYAYIKIKSVNFNTGSTNTSEAAKTTEILANIEDSDTDVLDGTPDGTTAGPSYFYGIKFATPTATKTNTYALVLFNTDGDITESSYFTISYRGIESSKSGTAITSNLISGTGTSSLQQTSASSASGSGSVAFGNSTQATGSYSVVIGNNTQAAGDSSFVAGIGTKDFVAESYSENQFVIGKYNKSEQGLFIVGNGSGPNDSERSNALIVANNKTTINTDLDIVGNTTINDSKQISFGDNNTTINKNTLFTTYVGNSTTPITHITAQTISADSLTVNNNTSSTIKNLNATILNIQSASDIDGTLTITDGSSFEVATGATATFNVKPTITGTKLYSDITSGQGVLVQTFTSSQTSSQTSGQANDPSWLSPTTADSILYYDNTGINWKAASALNVAHAESASSAATATNADKVTLVLLSDTSKSYKLLAKNENNEVGYSNITITPTTTSDNISGINNINGAGNINGFKNITGDSNNPGNISGFSNITSTGTITATTFNARSIDTTSDKRLKENIVDYKSEKSILDLPVYKYDFIDGPKDQIGCLAQDLQEICPEIVSENENGYLSIQESKLVYLLLDEVKKLKQEVEELKK